MTDRFRPQRFGIVGLYEYAEQEFGVEDGRLALRGRNTSGKSKALELLIPFVLDGDITPRKLDPFASSAKTMRWNLIECTDAHPDRRASKRIGYVWAEFRAPDGKGQERYLTCGVGLEATRHTDGVKDRWYFTTPQRVGADLTLTRMVGAGDAQPVIRADLAEQLAAGGGALHDGPTAYKEALRAQLIPFVSADLYEQMLEVIRQLRKPKLSDSLNVTRLSGMLTQALPAVDEALVRKLGDALEQLHELQRQHDELADARRQVASLVERELRAYARGVLGVRAERLRAADAGHERARAKVRSAAAEHDRLAGELTDAEHRAEQVQADFRRVDTEHLQLVRSEAYKVVALLEDRAREHDAAVARQARLGDLIQAAERRVGQALDGARQARALAGEAQEGLAVALSRLGELLAAAGLPTPTTPDRQALEVLAGRLELQRADVERALGLVTAVEAAEAALRALTEPLAAATERRDAASAATAEAEAQLEAATEQLQVALQDWRSALTELAVDDATLDAMAEGALAGDDPGGALMALVLARGDELSLERARLAARRETVEADLVAARDHLVAIEARRDPEPLVRSPRRSDRGGRTGAPLWAVCDFRDEVPAGDRAALEAALEESGILDAWIAADGTIADDVSLAATTPGGGRTLVDLLRADPGERPLDAAAVDGVLRSIVLEGVVSVAPGRFRFGALHGRATKPEAEYVGAAARAALRRRQLDEAHARIEALDAERGRLGALDEQHAAAQERLAAERAGVPSTEALRAALRAVARTADRLAGAEDQLARLVAERDRHEAARAQARDALAEAARSAGLPADGAALRAVDRALDRAEPARDRVAAAAAEHERAQAHAQAVAAQHASAESARRALEDERRAADDEVAATAGRLAAARAADGATAQELQARAAALRTRRETLDAERGVAERAVRELTGAVKDGERAVAEAEAALQAADEERIAAL